VQPLKGDAAGTSRAAIGNVEAARIREAAEVDLLTCPERETTDSRLLSGLSAPCSPETLRLPTI